jgi:hypothetical protein
MLENSVICDAALRKILTVMNSCLGKKKIKNEELFFEVVKNLNGILGESRANNILKDFDIDFQM